MKKSRYSEEQIIGFLNVDADADLTKCADFGLTHVRSMKALVSP